MVDMSLADDAEYEASIKLAISIEEKATTFYAEVAKACGALLATSATHCGC